MVCIAAFIILCIVGIFVAFISIFRRDIGRRYLKVFKQSLACVGKKATFQKCETGFKDNVKNGLLARVILKNPKLLKPASIIIEVFSVLIVLITVWSIVEVIKAGLALWVFGTCNVEHPASCALSSSEVCAIDGNTPDNPIEYIGQWFSDWGEIFGAIPDKFRSWDAANFDFEGIEVLDGALAPPASADSAERAIDIVDPGCVVCSRKFKEQLDNGFFDTHSVLLVPFVIKDGDGTTKFPNSDLIVRYLFALRQAYNKDNSTTSTGLAKNTLAYRVIKRIFTEKTDAKRDYQTYFNYDVNAEEAEATLRAWLTDFGLSAEEISAISTLARSDEITAILNKNHHLVMDDIHAKGIPTMIYDGKKH